MDQPSNTKAPNTNDAIAMAKSFYQAYEQNQPILYQPFINAWIAHVKQNIPNLHSIALSKSNISTQMIIHAPATTQSINICGSEVTFEARTIGVIIINEKVKENVASFEEQYNKQHKGKWGNLNAIYLIFEDIKYMSTPNLATPLRRTMHGTWIISISIELLIMPLPADYDSINIRRVTKPEIEKILLHQVCDVGGNKLNSSLIPRLNPGDKFAFWSLALPGEYYVLTAKLGYPTADEPYMINNKI